MSASPLLDGRRFTLASSTASAVDPEAPTWFEYHEADGLVWGDYAGDTVSTGHFVGIRSAGDRIEVSFAHALSAGGTATGTSSSRIERDEGVLGMLRLVEDFEVDGRRHRSVCVETPLRPA